MTDSPDRSLSQADGAATAETKLADAAPPEDAAGDRDLHDIVREARERMKESREARRRSRETPESD